MMHKPKERFIPRTAMITPPMPADTLTALQSSIAHWRRLATGQRNQGEMPTAAQCVLCTLFCVDPDSDDPNPFVKTRLTMMRGKPEDLGSWML